MTSETYNRLRLRGRIDDAGVAMMSVIMLILVLSMLALMVLAMVLTQSGPTLLQDKNVRTLAAAQAGLDAAAFQIRHANLGGTVDTPMGDIHKLPCTVSGPVEDTVDSPYFEVEIRYYKEDPDGKDSAWLADNTLDCYTAHGAPYGLREVARYALVTSEGFDPTATATQDRADRTLEANYTFQLTTRKVAGGRIWDDNNEHCWIADFAGEGSQVYYRDASSGICDEPSDLNSWIWADDYMIHLASTESLGMIPLCLSGRPHDNGNSAPMTLQRCTTTAQDPLGQRFAWMGEHTWRGQNAANTNQAASFIINERSSVSDGDRVFIGTNSGWKSVNPDPAVGKGNASYETDQVVNHLLFGRCLDVTDETVSRPYLITYPCKQDPSGGDSFSWNHKWYYDEPEGGQEFTTTKITVINNSGRTYCLIAPSSTTEVREAGTNNWRYEYFPRFIPGSNESVTDCTSATTNWKRYGYSDDEALAYHIMDNTGRCLSATGPRTTGHPMWNTVIVEPCADVESQKWNVPTDPVEASLSGFEEKTGRTD